MEPTTHDHRNIDPALGMLAGEGAQIRVEEDEFPVALAHEPVGYYGLPLLKEHVWQWPIPAYFFVGGAAGASSLLGAVLGLRGRHSRLARRARLLGLSGDLVSSALLIKDLGRPARFLNMLRVFRPSSPMSVGTFLLAGSGAANSAAVLFDNRFFALVGGALGIPLAGYTAVLLSTSAVPAWRESRKSLPFLFMSSGIASAASLLELLPSTRRERRVLGRYAIAGKVGELAATAALHRETRGLVGQPLRHGSSGAMLTAATALTATSLISSFFPRARTFSAVTGILGSLAMRFAVVHAGKMSARDPSASIR